MDLTSLFENFAFPIAICIVLLLALMKLWKYSCEQNEKRENELMKNLEKFGNALEKNNEAISIIASTLDRVCDRLDDIESKVKK